MDAFLAVVTFHLIVVFLPFFTVTFVFAAVTFFTFLTAGVVVLAGADGLTDGVCVGAAGVVAAGADGLTDGVCVDAAGLTEGVWLGVTDGV